MYDLLLILNSNMPASVYMPLCGEALLFAELVPACSDALEMHRKCIGNTNGKVARRNAQPNVRILRLRGARNFVQMPTTEKRSI